MKRHAILFVTALFLSSTVATAQLRRAGVEPTELTMPEDCMSPEMALAFSRTRLRVVKRDPSQGKIALAGAASLDGILFDEFAGPAEVSVALVGTLTDGSPYFIFPSPTVVQQDRRGNFKHRDRGPSAEELSLSNFVLRPGKDGDAARLMARVEVNLADGTTLEDFEPGTLELFVDVTLLDGTNDCGNHDVGGFASAMLN